MRYIRWIAVVFLLLLSVGTWVPKIRVAGIGPDLLIGPVFVFALYRGMKWGAWCGVIMGLLIGVEQPVEIGRDSLALAAAGIFVGRAAVGMNRRNPLIVFVLLFPAALLADTVRLLWLTAGDPWGLALLFLRQALPSAAYTTILLPAMAWSAAKLLGRREWMPNAP